MSTLDTAYALIAKWEGCRLMAYRCPAGVWTIGYGETLGVKQGDVWTQTQANMELRRRAGQFMAAVLKACPQLYGRPNMIAACTSLAYNIGIGAFRASSVCRMCKNEDFETAHGRFLLWNKAGGRVLRGLTRRREDEMAIFALDL